MGRWAEAAREYAAAYEEHHSVELLYRLGLARRRLREYSAARDAFRAYLRAAPAGTLKDEAERQLAQLDVLLEEEKRHPPSGTPRPKQRSAKKAAPPGPPAPPFSPRTTTVPKVAGADPPAALAAPAGPPRFSFSKVAPLLPVPLAAAGVAPAAPPSASRTAVPWLVAGAAVGLVGGGILWWDGSRVSRDLDARFASGELSAADGPRYGRARGESVAGRVLVGAALCAGAAAVWLWTGVGR